MAVRDIKTRLSIDGEKAFTKAVNEAGRNMRVLGSELKSAKASFDATGDEMDFLGSKSRILNAQIEQQKAIVAALEDAVRDSAAAYGDASAKTDGYRIKLNNARASLVKLEKELKETDEEALDLGRDSGRVGRQLEAGIGDAAEDAGDKVSRMVNELKSDLSSIGDSVSISAFVDFGRGITDVAGGIYDALKSVTEGTEEYRRQMAGLETNAMLAGYSPEFIKSMALDVAALTGDLDGAVEGMNNLMSAGLDESEIKKATLLLSGAAIRWAETLKFEGLADSFQESLASGASTGQFDELLSRLGLDMEQVRLSFEEAAKAGDEAVKTTAFAWIEGSDLEETRQAYVDVAGSLIEAEKAQLAWNDEMARTGDLLQPLMTEITNFGTGALGVFNDVLGGFNDMIVGLQESSAAARAEADAWTEEIDVETGYYTALDDVNAKIAEADSADNYWLGERYRHLRDEMRNNFTSYLQEEMSQADFSGYLKGIDLEAIAQEGMESSTAMIEGVTEGIEANAEDAEVSSEEAGAEIMSGLTQTLIEDGQQAIDATSQVMDEIVNEMNRNISYPSFYVPGYSGGGGLRRGVTEQTISLGLDGRTLASTSGSYYDTYLGLSASRTERYG